MQKNDCAVGIDIGGTTTSIGLVDRDGTLEHQATLATRADQPAESLVSRICDTIDELRGFADSRIPLTAIGIGAPNANYLRGTVENPPNLNWGESTDLVKLFQANYDLPVAVTNDANAAAIGEMRFGGARGMDHAIVITLGTGLGSGLIVNGSILYGAGGFAGELGHTTVDPAGRECACGKRGCLETYVSATGLCRTLVEMLSECRDDSSLREVNFNRLTSRLIHEAAVAGDPIALRAFDKTARILAMKLADAVAHTGPEAVFLAGGLSAAGELLISPTKRYLEQFLFAPYRGTVRLLRSELPEGSGAVLGAAALAWHETESSQSRHAAGSCT